jgi:hypothetical protein
MWYKGHPPSAIWEGLREGFQRRKSMLSAVMVFVVLLVLLSSGGGGIGTPPRGAIGGITTLTEYVDSFERAKGGGGAGGGGGDVDDDAGNDNGDGDGHGAGVTGVAKGVTGVTGVTTNSAVTGVAKGVTGDTSVATNSAAAGDTTASAKALGDAADGKQDVRIASHSMINCPNVGADTKVFVVSLHKTGTTSMVRMLCSLVQ